MEVPQDLDHGVLCGVHGVLLIAEHAAAESEHDGREVFDQPLTGDRVPLASEVDAGLVVEGSLVKPQGQRRCSGVGRWWGVR